MDKKKIILGTVIVFALMQFRQIDKVNPSIVKGEKITEQMQMPSDIAAHLKAACYDCHSHEVTYPWYTYVAPVSWWIGGHIKNGRKKLNFSTWGQYSEEDKKHILHECAEEILDKHMPPKSYKFMHEDAQWSEEETKKVVAYLEKSSK